jgi:hypothetical protein
VSEEPTRVGVPGGAKSTGQSGVVNPLSEVVAREGLIGEADVRAFCAGRFGLRRETAGDDATPNWEIHDGAVGGFDDREVVPFKAKDLGRAKPPEP